MVTMIPHQSVVIEIQLKELKNLFETYISLTPMFGPLIKLFKLQKKIDELNDGSWGTVPGPVLFNTLNSPEYI